ncbi:MAG: phosphotransferase enzyme family protein [Sarcina sp.]
MVNKESLKSILEQFDFKGECACSECHNVGNINDTTIVTYNDNGVDYKYIVQRINHSIFTNPKALMDNMRKITLHIADKVRCEGGDLLRECLNLVQTKEGKYFYKTEQGNYYRAFNFISDARTYMKVENEKHMYETGKAIGKFHKQLSDFNAASLFEVIKDFHNTPKRYIDFQNAIKEDRVGRVALVKEEIQFIEKRVDELSKLVNLEYDKKIPVRVTHNDTKFNNIMIDNQTGKAVCLIDLDTVMPGLSLYDIGDAIRSGCSTAEEDEIDLSKVTLDMNLYNNFVKGLLEESETTLNKYEIENIPFSAKLITIELAMRFLTDYINGDTYFKVSKERPNHNLERTRNQLKLASEMERKLEIQISALAM